MAKPMSTTTTGDEVKVSLGMVLSADRTKSLVFCEVAGLSALKGEALLHAIHSVVEATCPEMNDGTAIAEIDQRGYMAAHRANQA